MGNPAAEGLYAELRDSSDTAINWGSTNSLGYVNFVSVEEGDYTIEIIPSQSWSCSGCSLYQSQSIAFTASTAEVDESGTQVLDTVQMEMASRYITVTVVDQNGNPIEGMYVSGWTNGGLDVCHIGIMIFIDKLILFTIRLAVPPQVP